MSDNPNQIVEAIELLQRQRREPIIMSDLGWLLYDDGKKSYAPLIRPLSRSVSNVESFAAYVVKAASRADNVTGEGMTASFSERGGVCYLKDGETEDLINYERRLSPAWKFVNDRLDRSFSHKELIRFFQALRGSFTVVSDYQSTRNAYTRVSFDDKTTVESQPILSDGKILFSYKREAGLANGEWPGAIMLNLQYARGSARSYPCEIEIEAELAKSEIIFRLAFADKEKIIQEAIEDEISDFKAATAGLSQMLVVMNF